MRVAIREEDVENGHSDGADVEVDLVLQVPDDDDNGGALAGLGGHKGLTMPPQS